MKSHQQHDRFYDTDIPVFTRVEKKDNSLNSELAWVIYVLLGGFAFALWSPLWFGAPSNGRAITGIIYLFGLTAWLPLTIRYIQSNNKKLRNTLVFFLVAVAWAILVIYILFSSITTISLLSGMDVTACEAIDGQYQCVLATCEPTTDLQACSPETDHGRDIIGSYTLEKIAFLPMYNIVHKDLILDVSALKND